MYKIGYLGNCDKLPEMAAAIYDHDLPKLELLLQKGMEINTTISIGDGIRLSHLELAVFRNDMSMIKFLMEHGASSDLAVNNPLLLTSVRCCDPEVVSFFGYQANNLSNDQKSRAFQEAVWGNRPENISVLEKSGISVSEYGGKAFRMVVSAGKMEFAKIFAELGVDINYHKPDMIFPYASTPVTEAARSNNFPMVNWLVTLGADITIMDKYGDRPYTLALKNKNQEMIEYLKALEPEEWHNEQEKIRLLKPYKLPSKMVKYLKEGPLRLEFPEQELVKWIELYSYMDLQEFTWKKRKFLSHSPKGSIITATICCCGVLRIKKSGIWI